jgi:uncharacterized caspase-like protein
MRFIRLLMVLLRSAVVLLALAASGSYAADGTKRLALIVGNSAYENVSPLANPANDATDMAQKVKTLGFDVLLATDASHTKLSTLLREFRERVTKDHVALVFFAGHGVTVNRESFIIPVDAPEEIDLDEKGEPRVDGVHRHLVSMASVLAPLEAAKIGIVFLDACRTNAAEPNPSSRVLSLKSRAAVQILRGNGSMEIKPSAHSAGVFRAYATQLDNVASDGEGRNSPFTKALLKHIGTKGISIQELMIRVRRSVMEDTAGKQIPWEEAALNESFYFVPQPPVSAAPSPSAPQRTPPAATGAPAKGNSPPARSGSPSAGIAAGL